MSQTAHAFEYASEQLKGDRKFVFEVVLQQPLALQHATEELRSVDRKRGQRKGGTRRGHRVPKESFKATF